MTMPVIRTDEGDSPRDRVPSATPSGLIQVTNAEVMELLD